MPIQTIPLDYSWMVNLANMIAQAREQERQRKWEEKRERPTVTGAGKMTAEQRYAPGFIEKFKAEEKEKAGLEREERMTQEQFAHEIELKKMELESTKATSLAEAMSAERIAGVGAEAGIEEARIGGAAVVGAAQKTTMEKGYEFVEMLMDMDEESANQLIANLEAKRAQQVEGPPSTITAEGRTITLPSAPPTKDPNDPLTWLEGIGAYTEGGGAPRPKPTGAAAKPETEQFNELIDDMLTKNPQYIIALTTGKGWDEAREAMRTIGGEAGFSDETIDSVISMYEAIVPKYEEPEEGGGLAGAIKSVLTPLGLGREELPPEAVPGAEAYLGGAGAPKEAPLVEKAPGFAKNLGEFIETIITGPFHPAYKEWKGKKTDKVVKTEKKEELTEQDVVTEMRTWSKGKVEEFQAVAKKAGLYKGPINGLHSKELDNVMRKYFKEHPEEWGETK